MIQLQSFVTFVIHWVRTDIGTGAHANLNTDYAYSNSLYYTWLKWSNWELSILAHGRKTPALLGLEQTTFRSWS